MTHQEKVLSENFLQWFFLLPQVAVIRKKVKSSKKFRDDIHSLMIKIKNDASD